MASQETHTQDAERHESVGLPDGHITASSSVQNVVLWLEEEIFSS